MKERCSGWCYERDGGYACGFVGKVKEGGKWWCLHHLPSSRREKSNKRAAREAEGRARRAAIYAERSPANVRRAAIEECALIAERIGKHTHDHGAGQVIADEIRALLEGD